MAKLYALEAAGLEAAYGRHRVLQGLSLHVEEGMIYGFLGLNGAGKSTTIRLILRLLRQNAGSVRLFGRDPDSDRRVLQQVGSLVETPGFYDQLSGWDNLRQVQILRGLPGRSIAEALDLTGLTEAARRLVRTYSTGMKQRLGLSWALMGRPRLLVLDEPTNGLDPAGVKEVRELLRRLRDEHGTTIFLSSHILSEIQQLADRIGIIHGGRLAVEEDAVRGGAEVLRVKIRCAQGARAAARAMADLAWVRLAGPADGEEVSVELPAARAGELNALLNRAGLTISEFAAARQELEDYFLAVTGGVNHA